ncbi:MAG TPA: heavy metal-associated domain-containing protein [Longimicrobiales bacterium]|nr:heavy metal-associated domain-containing protein [Longimicrobiales bacterium]
MLNRGINNVAVVTMAVLVGLAGCDPDRAGDGAAAEAATEVRAEAAAPGQADLAADRARAEFAVIGMDCGGCAIAARLALKRIPGVDSAGADYEAETGEGRAWAVYDPSRARPDQLAAAIEELGYTASLKED